MAPSFVMRQEEGERGIYEVKVKPYPEIPSLAAWGQELWASQSQLSQSQLHAGGTVTVAKPAPIVVGM